MSGWWVGLSKTQKIREIALFCFFFSKKEDEIIFGVENYLNRKIYIVIHICITMPQEIIERNILHYPQLDTILMVENFIRENSGEFKKKSLWENLPKKMIYQTFCVIFDYLSESGKIAQDSEGWVVWIWNPELVKKYLNKPHLRWRK